MRSRSPARGPQPPQGLGAKSELKHMSPGGGGCRAGKGELLPPKCPAIATQHPVEHVAERSEPPVQLERSKGKPTMQRKGLLDGDGNT